MQTVSYNQIINSKLSGSKYILAPSQLTILEINNKNVVLIKNLLSRVLKNSDNGNEVGSINYISQSKYHFVRAKALQKDHYLPIFNKETVVPIKIQVFKDFNLKEGDLIISKDSNIGEAVILDQNYNCYTICGALYRLPIERYKFYLFAFLKHSYFKKQLDLLVPKGSTIRHAKTLFLDCKIPFPNQNNANDIIKYVEFLTLSIFNKEKEIRKKNDLIFNLIEKELLENQKNNQFVFQQPLFKEIHALNRLDTGIYGNSFKKIDFLIKNYKNGYFKINKKNIKAGNTPIKRIIDNNKNLDFAWVTPANISDYGQLIHNTRINCNTYNLKQNSLLIINRTSRGNSGEYVGMSMFYDFNLYGNGQHNQGLYRIVNYEQNTLCFIGLFLNSPYMRTYCANLSVGSKMKELKLNQISEIPFPQFPIEKQNEISSLYHNNLEYPKNLLLDNLLQEDEKWNKQVGIIELDVSIKKIKEKLNNILDKIVNDEMIDIVF